MRKKTQKNLQFPPEAIEWFEREELRTEASHSRIALACLVAYMQASEGARGQYLRQAVEIDKGLSPLPSA